jgi:hypothetical protein
MESFVIIAALALATAWLLAYKRANGIAWSIWVVALVAAIEFGTGTPGWVCKVLWAAAAVFAAFAIV